jgi:hypothetical protein
MFDYLQLLLFNTTNNICVISRLLVYLVAEAEFSPRENYRHAIRTDKASPRKLYRVHPVICSGRTVTTFMVLGTDRMGRSISNYHTIEAMTLILHAWRHLPWSKTVSIELQRQRSVSVYWSSTAVSVKKERKEGRKKGKTYNFEYSVTSERQE